MAYAHSRRIIHRDLKPENIMLGQFGETLIVDWGLARSFGDLQNLTAVAGSPPMGTRLDADGSATREGTILGTPSFMSPEQAAGQIDALGPASDIYSLGAILYVLLTGQRPFQASTRSALLAQVQAGQFPFPRQRNQRVPRALECICLKAMALRPETRYATAKDFGADVVRWLSDESVSAYRAPFPVRLKRWERRVQWTVPRVMYILFFVYSLFWIVMLERVDNRHQRKLNELREEMKQIQSQYK
jgi:serine/threonine protein kinase